MRTIVHARFGQALAVMALCWLAGIDAAFRISVSGQVRDQTQAVFGSEVDLIRLDVSAVDRQNQPVRGLTQADFAIKEDGRVQTIQTFASVELPEASLTGATWTRDVAPDVVSNTSPEADRLVVLVMDDNLPSSRTDFWPVNAAKGIGGNVIEQLGPQDLAAVVYTCDSRNNQEFTHDRARLLAAVNRYEPGRVRVADAARVDVLRRVAEVLGAVKQRRKALIWVNGAGGPGDATAQYVWKQALTSLRLSNVNVYLIDPNGLEVPGAQDYEYSLKVIGGRQRFLLEVASMTGGRAFVDSNEFKSKVIQIFRETAAFYLLGYASTKPGADGRFRRIEVKVNRPGVTVHTRSGYYAPDPPDLKHPPLPPPSKAVEALAGLVPERDVSLSLTAAPFAVAGQGQAAVAVALGWGETPDSPHGGPFDVVVKAFTFDGELRQTVQLRVPAADGAALPQALVRFDLPPGRYQVRAAASGAQGKSGSVYADLEVPDFGKEPLSLSGVVLTTVPAPASTPADALARLLPSVPVTRRMFAPAEHAIAFLQLYQGRDKPLAPVTLAVRLMNARDVMAAEAKETLGTDRFTADHEVDYRYVLPLAGLEPGEYLLTVEATLGKTTARRDVRFTVK
jgi:VWFA-related protein